MIVLNRDGVNNFVVNVSKNRTSTLSTYLIELKFDMSNHKIYFLSTNSSPYPDRYDKFGVILVSDEESEDPINSVIYYNSGYGSYGTYTIYEYNGGDLIIDLEYIVKTLEIGKFKVDFVNTDEFMVSNSVATITSDNSFYIAPVLEPSYVIAYKQLITLYPDNWVYNETMGYYIYLFDFTDYVGEYTISYKSLNPDYSFGITGLNSSQNGFNMIDTTLSLGQIIINYPTLPTDIVNLEIIHNNYQTITI